MSEQSIEDSSPQVKTGSGWVLPTLIFPLLSLAIGLSIIIVYHKLYAPKINIAIIDVASVVELKRFQLMSIGANPKATDADRAKVFEEIQNLGPTLQSALNEIQRECDCLLMVRGAIVAGGSVDYTDLYKSKLGMADMTKEGLLKAMQPGTAPQSIFSQENP